MKHCSSEHSLHSTAVVKNAWSHSPTPGISTTLEFAFRVVITGSYHSGINVTVFWDVTPCGLENFPDILEEHSRFIFMAGI
jgi:hypothetical protein